MNSALRFVLSLTILVSVWVTACGEEAPKNDAFSDTAFDVPTPPDVPEVDAQDAGPEDTGPALGLGIDYEAETQGVQVRFDASAEDWMGTGWPTDRLLIDGVPDLGSFPGWDMDLLDQYLAYGMEVLDGWGTNGSIYLEFEGELDTSSFPNESTTSGDTKSLIQLVNVTEGSSRYGEQMPLQMKFYLEGSDLYYRAKTLVLRPVLGFPLAPGETYCALVTRGIKDADGHYLGQSSALMDALSSVSYLAPFNAWLAGSALIQDDIAGVTCFTTSQPTKLLRSVLDHLAELPSSELTDIEYLGQANAFHELRGHYQAPNFQAGEKPYTEGGDIQLDEAGTPIVQQQEDIRFLMLIPTAYPMPEAGWPVVQYAHGTGGDYETCKSSVGPGLTMEGFAVICIDQPLHGERGPFDMGKCSNLADAPDSLCKACETSADCEGNPCSELDGKGTFCTADCTIPTDCPEGFTCQPLEGLESKQCVPQGNLLTDSELVLYSFNYLNPRSGRTSFLQSAIDTMNLTRMIQAGQMDRVAEATALGEAIRFDAANVQLFGHSHGGLSGALVLGVDPLLSAGFLSGAGGGLLYTMLVREDPVNVSDLVTTILEIKDKDFDIFHPALTLIQTLVDATDPLNYARYWLQPAPGGTSKHVFITEGTADHATPGETTEAMAAAAGVHMVIPVVQESLPHSLLGLPAQEEPVYHNVVDSFGEKRTAGLRQWKNGDHWVALNDTIAEKLWRSWFRSIRKGYDPAISQD
jgi:hypothetical protein